MTKVEGLSGHIITQVAAGRWNTVVLTSDGAVFTFGSNDNGLTGHGTSEGNQTTPMIVRGCLEGKRVVYIATNKDHSACIDEDGELYTWGKGQCGRLGHGDKSDVSSPRLVEGLTGKKCSAVACGEYHTLVLVENGRVYSFGLNSWGQLGHGDTQNRLAPALIEASFEGKIIKQVACGWSHNMALCSGGYLYTWGYGEYGALGHRYEKNYAFPYILHSLIGYKVVKFQSSHCHSVVLVASKKSHSFKAKEMIDNETCSDIVFILKDNNDERVHANKGILIGQSEYFCTMFRNDMRESRENVIELRECCKSVLLLFLEYLYTGSVNFRDDSEEIMELYALSHRYQENGLCERCIEMIETKMSEDNAMSLLVKAHGLGLEELQGTCMEYVVSHFQKSYKRELLESQPSLMLELLDGMSMRKNKKARVL